RIPDIFRRLHAPVGATSVGRSLAPRTWPLAEAMWSFSAARGVAGRRNNADGLPTGLQSWPGSVGPRIETPVWICNRHAHASETDRLRGLYRSQFEPREGVRRQFGRSRNRQVHAVQERDQRRAARLAALGNDARDVQQERLLLPLAGLPG